ncbi:MAG: hypothetical protein IPF53_15850 [Blastocatellia bacterium]|nr:hypothetical protein [Blastocatellia bacterium]
MNRTSFALRGSSLELEQPVADTRGSEARDERDVAWILRAISCSGRRKATASTSSG